MSVTKEVLAEIRARTNIVDIVAESVVLKRAGSQYRGLCPFHKEKTPSFNVSSERGIFKCYGCNEGGDVFAFVQKVRSCSFLDAVRDLADRCGVILIQSEQDREEYDKKSMMYRLYEETCGYYQSLLEHPEEGFIGREYLNKRGMDAATIEKFRMGYAPNAWDGLLTYLTRKMNVSQQLLAEAGLVREKQGGGSHYDLFRHRLMVPIRDLEGRVIAFGGRTLGDDQVKYINSPESPIYKKGEHLFALNLAKESIKKNNSVIVVEGYFDAITPHQFGFTNTVATLGTAMTEAQARLLVRFSESKRVFLSFDSDAAGQKAIERGVETLSQIAEGIGIDLRIIRIPGGKDPDECLRSSEPLAGVEGFQKALETAPHITDWQIEESIKGIDLKSHSGRIEASRRVIAVVGKIKTASARVEYVRQCASLLNIREEELLVDVRQYRTDNRLDAPSKGSSPFQPQNGNGWQGKNGGGGGGGGGGKAGGGGKFQGKGKGKFQKKEEDEGAPLTRKHREIATVGLTNAERQLLALYLVSRDDLEIVANSLADWQLLTPEHQEIKVALEGIGTQFNTMDDLQYQLMDRLAGLDELRGPLTEIILIVEQIRKQNLPVRVVISDYKSRILLSLAKNCLSRLTQMLGMSNDSAMATQIMTRIKELNQLIKVELVSAKTDQELDELKRRIEQIEVEFNL